MDTNDTLPDFWVCGDHNQPGVAISSHTSWSTINIPNTAWGLQAWAQEREKATDLDHFLWLDWPSTTCNLNQNLWLWVVGHHCGERPQFGRWKRGKGRMIHGMGSKAGSEKWEWWVKGWPERPAGHPSPGNVWGWAITKGQLLLWGPGAVEGACVVVCDSCPH